jgi:predicted RNA binding protein YcfA (HicA-like mRNA interferase family)
MVARLVPLHPTKIEKKLKRLGFTLDRVDGSIRFYIREKAGKKYVVQVHFHPEEKGLDVIAAILRNGGITRTEWENA